MDDIPFLKLIVVIITMVAIASLAQTDSNNPLVEIGIPVDVNSFNIYSLGLQAPQVATLQVPPLDGTDEEKICWIAWWCPDLPTDPVARAIQQMVIVVYNFIAYITNSILLLATITVLLVLNFFTLFNFSSWSVFQGDIFFLLFGAGLTALLGGAVFLWVVTKVTGSIPLVGGWG